MEVFTPRIDRIVELYESGKSISYISKLECISEEVIRWVLADILNLKT